HLGAAVDALQSRAPSPALDEAAAVVHRASARLRLSADHTVVALAGATGSGKSSTFNALTDLDVAAVGVRRPTTSWAMACLWGSDGAADLLEWLGIPQRHQVVRDSLLDRGDDQLQGMVLLDLPDHDSTEVAHRLEVDRLVHLADVIVWVMDPQKYADAAIHDRLLKPNMQHAGVMVAVVNHIDEVPDEGRENLYRDARRLLDDDGLSSVPLIATSARVGTGLDELRAELATRVADKAASRTRISTDVDIAAQRLSSELGAVPSSAAVPALRERLVSALADARRNPDGSVQTSPVLPEMVRNIVRTELRNFSADVSPAASASISDRGMAEVDNLVAALNTGSTPEKATAAPGRRGVSPVAKTLFFLLFLAGGAWLAAAVVKGVPNAIAAGAVTGVALVAWITSILIKRRDDAQHKPLRSDLESALVSAVDRSVIAAVSAEVGAYEQASSDVRAALSR
ncbi:MAG TPA: GTPase, partial [Marmoricola sp.]|nr:GTPase [Marmoricola sp.]